MRSVEGEAAMDIGEKGSVESCRLIRTDGSVWTVTEFRLRNGGAWISAHRSEPHRAQDGDDGDGDRERLDDVPLEAGDRLRWVRSDGSVVWAMRNPTTSELRWRERGRAGGGKGREDDASAASTG